MRFRPVTGVEPSALGPIFFAQALDELLYDYSPASFKPRVMGLTSLCDEALSLIAQIEAEQIHRSRIDPVLEEIHHVVRTDPVAKLLLDFDVDFYVAFLPESKPSDLAVRLRLLANKLGDGAYINALQEKLVEICVSDREKKLIYQTARRWVCALVAEGYTKQFIRQRVEEFFFSNLRISDPSGLKVFFRSFSFRVEKFLVYFAVAGMLSDVSKVAERFGVIIVRDRDPILANLQDAGLVVNSDQVVAYFSAKALDRFAARDKAERVLAHISDLLVLYHHKSKIQWSLDVVVRLESSEEFDLVTALSTGMKHARDNLPGKAAEKMHDIFMRLTFSDRDSAGRFVSVVRLHGAAVEAVSSEAQLVNLWTAMEVLVHRESESKLRAVMNLLTPFLVYGYIERLLFFLAGDLYRWRRHKFYKIIKLPGTRGWRTHHRLAAVLRGGEFEGKRSELYEMVNDYALLRFRCFQISELISSTKHLNAALIEHERRVEWQIKRIYRCRNSIVHDGSVPEYLVALTENAHEYLDAFISRFLELRTKMAVATSLEEAAIFQSRAYRQWRDLLKTDFDISPSTVRDGCALTP